MGGTAKGKVQIATSILESKAEYLNARSEALDWRSNSRALSQIVDFWLALGAPPLSELDALRPTQPIPKEIRVPVLRAWEKYVGKLPPTQLPVRA